MAMVGRLATPTTLNFRSRCTSLIDDDGMDLAGFDIGQQVFQRWPVQTSASELAIVVAVGEVTQPWLRLTQDIGFGALSLSI